MKLEKGKKVNFNISILNAMIDLEKCFSFKNTLNAFQKWEKRSYFKTDPEMITISYTTKFILT